MKKIVLLLTCFSSLAMAENDAANKAQNDEKTQKVANALACAETGQLCLKALVYQVGGGGLQFEVNFDRELVILRDASTETQIYNSSDLERISKGIEVLEQKQRLK